MKKFEYLKLERDYRYKDITQLELNDLGSRGWELVTSTLQTNAGWVNYFFKREFIIQ